MPGLEPNVQKMKQILQGLVEFWCICFSIICRMHKSLCNFMMLIWDTISCFDMHKNRRQAKQLTQFITDESLSRSKIFLHI